LGFILRNISQSFRGNKIKNFLDNNPTTRESQTTMALNIYVKRSEIIPTTGFDMDDFKGEAEFTAGVKLEDSFFAKGRTAKNAVERLRQDLLAKLHKAAKLNQPFQGLTLNDLEDCNIIDMDVQAGLAPAPQETVIKGINEDVLEPTEDMSPGLREALEIAKGTPRSHTVKEAREAARFGQNLVDSKNGQDAGLITPIRDRKRWVAAFEALIASPAMEKFSSNTVENATYEDGSEVLDEEGNVVRAKSGTTMANRKDDYVDRIQHINKAMEAAGFVAPYKQLPSGESWLQYAGVKDPLRKGFQKFGGGGGFKGGRGGFKGGRKEGEKSPVEEYFDSIVQSHGAIREHKVEDGKIVQVSEILTIKSFASACSNQGEKVGWKVGGQPVARLFRDYCYRWGFNHQANKLGLPEMVFHFGHDHYASKLSEMGYAVREVGDVPTLIQVNTLATG
jgi:hypothetical protein